MRAHKRTRLVLTGSPYNIRFDDLATVVQQQGFRFDRVVGSHRIYEHPQIPEILVLQPERGRAKPYQV